MSCTIFLKNSIGIIEAANGEPEQPIVSKKTCVYEQFGTTLKFTHYLVVKI
jgi:hypothetical protein